MRAINWSLWRVGMCAALMVIFGPRVAASSDAPQWMHAAAAAPLPEHDEKTNAVLLYSETNVTVLSADKIKTQVRKAYKILRPNEREHGILAVHFNPQRKIKTLHGWCIPAKGKDYEVKDKDAVERSLSGGGELVSDTKFRVLEIPAPDPGNVVGYEYEVEEQPFFLQDSWEFQEFDPVRESHYSLQLPQGWEYQFAWLNYPEVKPTSAGNNLWTWTVNDVKAIRKEPEMPPFHGVAGEMVVTFFPPGGRAVNGFAAWSDMGKWYGTLTKDRVEASPEIKQEVATLTAGKATDLQKMQALASFLQHDIRYVAILLGIGGWQPHAAADVFAHRYGDCKDKATLLRTMLSQIGVDSFHVLINAERGTVSADSPAHNAFNHVVLAIKLPDDVKDDPSIIATMQHPRLGRLLFFDPTNELTPLGQIGGYLQANYGLLVTPDGGELVELPEEPTTMNGIRRTGKLTLDPTGTLKGEVSETRIGDRAWDERRRQHEVSKNADRIKPIEDLLSGSMSIFRITQASVVNLEQTDRPFGFNYAFEAQGYAKIAGGMLLVRPRVLGVQASGVLETKEKRQFPVEFEGPVRDTDSFEITVPAGYVVDDLPPAVDADYDFASYHSRTQVNGNVISYSRTFEIKELSVPVNRADDLKKFYRIVASDERNTAVLKAGAN